MIHAYIEERLWCYAPTFIFKNLHRCAKYNTQLRALRMCIYQANLNRPKPLVNVVSDFGRFIEPLVWRQRSLKEKVENRCANLHFMQIPSIATGCKTLASTLKINTRVTYPVPSTKCSAAFSENSRYEARSRMIEYRWHIQEARERSFESLASSPSVITSTNEPVMSRSWLDDII